MRYKGRPSEQTLARQYPHVVEIAVPLGGFGRRLDTMYEHLRGVAHQRGPGRNEDEQNFTRWIFARREDAEAFAKPFGGTVVTTSSGGGS
jgi:hypothetical protein